MYLPSSFMVQFPHGIMLTLVWSKFITSSAEIDHFLMISSTHFKNSCLLSIKSKGSLRAVFVPFAAHISYPSQERFDPRSI